MKIIKTVFAAAALAAVTLASGCAVYPAPYAYGPQRGYYQPAPYYGPTVGIGVYGGRGWHEGGRYR